MNDETKRETAQEIVLIRHVVDSDHDEAHAGVWKVAFADFMTAMMSFFLVLWIVNSTSKETRVSVARYFNPVRLQEATVARKGVNKSSDAATDDAVRSLDDAAKRNEKKVGSTTTVTPDGAVASLPSPIGKASRQASIGSDQRIHDPFARTMDAGTPQQTNAPPTSTSVATRAQDMAKARAGEEASAVRAELATSLGDEFAKLGAALDVVVTEDGLLISVSDQSDFGMFAVGSASPEARLMRVLAAIGASLRTRPGSLVIRGHTDSRPYRAGGSDNWQLSTARAQAAHNVLVAEGLDDDRIEHIEGYADHRLKTPSAPEAPENRRIEILIRQDRRRGAGR